MASGAFAGVGTSFRRWDGSQFGAIAEINTITGPGMTRDVIDVTSLDSTGGYREFITGFRNSGTVTLAMNFTRVTYEVMLADFESDDLVSYEIALPDGTDGALESTIEFDGLVTELPMTIPADDKVTADITIQISGPIDLNSGLASSA
jgi:predicted secreted protein